MKVLSLFDGISCARVALKRLRRKVDVYYASEIDQYAIQIAQKNFPDTVHVGDVTKLSKKFDDIDLLIGGSPCQDLSIAKAGRKGLDGARSGLFWKYVKILKKVKPKYFLLENVASMSKKDRAIITKTLGVEPIMINAALVSAQNRKRLFWTNIPNVVQPTDREIYLKDILLDGSTEDLKSLCITATYHKKCESDFKKCGTGQMIQVGNIGSEGEAHRVYSAEGKSRQLSALGGGQGAKTGLYIVQQGHGFNKGGVHKKKSPTLTQSKFEHNNHVSDGFVLRKLHPIECERLQGLPDNYTEGISDTQRYKTCGNGFNVDVVAHILSFIPKK